MRAGNYLYLLCLDSFLQNSSRLLSAFRISLLGNHFYLGISCADSRNSMLSADSCWCGSLLHTCPQLSAHMSTNRLGAFRRRKDSYFSQHALRDASISARANSMATAQCTVDWPCGRCGFIFTTPFCCASSSWWLSLSLPAAHVPVCTSCWI